MKRDVNKMSDKGQELLDKYRRYDLNSGEMNELYKIFTNAKDGEQLWTLMLTAFQFGTAVGYRIAKKEAKNKASVKKISA